MTARLELDFASSPIEATPADVAVVCFFSDERPLRADAGRADWRLCGRLSTLVSGERVAAGSALLAPTEAKLAAPLLLGVDLGESALWSFQRARRAGEELANRLLGLACRSAVLAPPGVALGTLSPAHATEALIVGCGSALQGADRGLQLTLVGVDRDVRRSSSLTAAIAETERRGVPVHLDAPAPAPGVG